MLTAPSRPPLSQGGMTNVRRCRWLTYLLWEKWPGTGKEVGPAPGQGAMDSRTLTVEILEEVAALPSLLVFAQSTKRVFV